MKDSEITDKAFIRRYQQDYKTARKGTYYGSKTLRTGAKVEIVLYEHPGKFWNDKVYGWVFKPKGFALNEYNIIRVDRGNLVEMDTI